MTSPGSSERFSTLGAALGALGVAAGAFGAHALRDRVEPRHLAVWDTAAEYLLWHALALVLVGLLIRQGSVRARPIRVAGRALSFGVVVFSGSLYVLVLSGVGWLGAITPVGGVSLIVGWGALAYACWPQPNQSNQPNQPSQPNPPSPHD